MISSDNPPTTTLRQRRHSQTLSAEQSPLPQPFNQTAGDFPKGSTMFNGSFTINDNCNQSPLQSRLNQFQQRHHDFDTYPPKKTSSLDFQTQKKQSTSNTLTNNLEQAKHIMPLRNSPLRATNTGRFYTKRSAMSARRSYSESSAEKQLHKYSSSDSSQEDEAAAEEKRKMTRRSSSNGLQYNHKYKSRRMSGHTAEDYEAMDGCAVFGKRSQHISDLIDIAIRVVLVIVFSKLETQTAFKRIIHAEEMWLYKNPRTKDYVSPLSLIVAVIFAPFLVTLLNFMATKDKRDFRAASWTWTLILGLNGLATSLLKISVGRPRPDYFYRCFPDGIMQLAHNGTGTDNMLDLFNCTGNLHDINEGRKSFPSGHSSFAFAAFGFISYYIGAKLHAFNRCGRGETWRLCVSITPLVLATLIAVSRTCDYHHHWEDVTVGSLIGLFVSYYIYRQYYPSIFSIHCHRPYPRSVHQIKTTDSVPSHTRRRLQSYKRLATEETEEFGGTTNLLCEEQADAGFPNATEKRPLITEQKNDNKWF